VYKPETEFDVQTLTVDQLVCKLRESSPEDSSIFFEEIIKRFEPLVRKVWRRGAHIIEYNDFAQDAFLRLFRGLPKLQNPKAFPGYFRSIVVSVLLDQFRKGPVPFTEEAGADLVAEGLDDQILTGIFIRSYLEHLPPREKEVISLEYLHDYSLADIAKKLELKPGTVRMAKARGLNRLRDLFLRDAKALEESP
jgi:RNA polymerase sigma factor (sigma-70 family)